MVLDQKTGTNLLQWPVEEIESLRLDGKEFNNITVEAGSVIPLAVESASQVIGYTWFDKDRVPILSVVSLLNV